MRDGAQAPGEGGTPRPAGPGAMLLDPPSRSDPPFSSPSKADELIEADMADSDRLMDLYERLDELDAGKGRFLQDPGLGRDARAQDIACFLVGRDTRDLDRPSLVLSCSSLQPRRALRAFSTVLALPRRCRPRRPR